MSREERGCPEFVYWGKNHFRVSIPKKITENLKNKLSLAGFRKINGVQSEYISSDKRFHIKIDEENGAILLFSSHTDFKQIYNMATMF